MGSINDTLRISTLNDYAVELTYKLADGCRCMMCHIWTAEAYFDTMEIGVGETIKEAIDDFIVKNKIIGELE